MRSFIFFALSVSVAFTASAQMIQTQVPFQNLNSSFYENNGISWNVNGPGFFANFGGATVPPFGNPDPNAGLRTGAAFGGNGIRGNVGFNFGQGSNRSIVSTTPSVTTMNGMPGSITSQTVRPFVTGITPVVGGYPSVQPGEIPGAGQQMRNQVIASQQAELAQRIRKSNDMRQMKALENFNRGQRAEVEGNKKMARANYRLALNNAQGLLRVEIIKRMQANGWAR